MSVPLMSFVSAAVSFAVFGIALSQPVSVLRTIAIVGASVGISSSVAVLIAAYARYRGYVSR